MHKENAHGGIIQCSGGIDEGWDEDIDSRDRIIMIKGLDASKKWDCPYR